LRVEKHDARIRSRWASLPFWPDRPPVPAWSGTPLAVAPRNFSGFGLAHRRTAPVRLDFQADFGILKLFSRPSGRIFKGFAGSAVR